MLKVKDIDYIQENSLKTHTDCAKDAFQMGLLDRFETKEFDVNKKPNFTFIDLFAGFPCQPFFRMQPQKIG